MQPRTEGGSRGNRYRPADVYQHDRDDSDRDRRRPAGDEYCYDLDDQYVDRNYLHISDNRIERYLLNGATFEVRKGETQEEPP